MKSSLHIGASAQLFSFCFFYHESWVGKCRPSEKAPNSQSEKQFVGPLPLAAASHRGFLVHTLHAKPKGLPASLGWLTEAGAGKTCQDGHGRSTPEEASAKSLKGCILCRLSNPEMGRNWGHTSGRPGAGAACQLLGFDRSLWKLLFFPAHSMKSWWATIWPFELIQPFFQNTLAPGDDGATKVRPDSIYGLRVHYKVTREWYISSVLFIFLSCHLKCIHPLYSQFSSLSHVGKQVGHFIWIQSFPKVWQNFTLTHSLALSSPFPLSTIQYVHCDVTLEKLVVTFLPKLACLVTEQPNNQQRQLTKVGRDLHPYVAGWSESSSWVINSKFNQSLDQA